MSKGKNNVYKKYNNVQNNFLSLNSNMVQIVNLAVGFHLADESSLRDCDSKEVALIMDEAEAILEGKGKGKSPTVSMELLRDIKKQAVMKRDDNFVYICIENQSTWKGDMRERINLYNAIAYIRAMDENGKRIPVITVLSGWCRQPYDKDMRAFDDYNVGADPKLLEYLPNYRIPVVNMPYITDEELAGLNTDIKVVVMALRIAMGKLNYEEKKSLYVRLDEMRNEASKEALDVVLCYTEIESNLEEIMENGFTTFFEETRQRGRLEGRLEGKQEGIIEGTLNNTQQNISQLQKNLNISFEKAADLLGLTGDMREKVRAMA